MTADVVIVDTNLLMLLVVGSTSIDYIKTHKRLQQYDVGDFVMLAEIVAEFSDIVLLPHVLAEASGLLRQIANPAKDLIQARFRNLISVSHEAYVPSVVGAAHEEFSRYGLTDAVILSFCALKINGLEPTLVTADTPLANMAAGLGLSVIDYNRDFGN